MSYILGIWDGHDSGAALIKGDKILFAANEERYTKRKLEIRFPFNSIRECLRYENIKPKDISGVALSTSDFSKTLTRILPGLKEEYYLIRRRKKKISDYELFKKRIKYLLTEKGSHKIFKEITRYKIKKELRKIGFNKPKISIFDHHLCHAQAAARTSKFDDALVITLDGLGDGLSGTISTYEKGKLKKKSDISSDSSFGIFFEYITNILNMRELEDEGKVMALADFSAPIDISKNLMIDFFKIEGLKVKAKYGCLRMYDKLFEISKKVKPEQFAFMAQQSLEKWALTLINNAIKRFNKDRLCLAGGVFANIKLNMKISDIAKDYYIFPHMGDGGLALGAAITLNKCTKRYKLNDLYLGNSYSDKHIEDILKKSRLNYKKIKQPGKLGAKIIKEGNILIWFRGRMEYGPRALGNRSILARADSKKIKDRLNASIKRRDRFQPFCPSMLLKDCKRYLKDFKRPTNRFMTTGYIIKEDSIKYLKGVINIDNSTRPHIVKDENPEFARLLSSAGVVLNTSLNIHGYPLACSPKDALKIFKEAKGIDHMIIEDFHVSKTKK